MLDALDLILIHQLLGRYGHLLDASDWDGLAALFWPDAVLDYTAVRAPSVCVGRDEILGYFRAANHPSAHHVGNIVVDETADRAGSVEVHSKFWVPFTRETHDPKRLYGGDYHDVVRHSADGWRFTRKVCTPRWQMTFASGGVDEHRRTF